MARHAKPITPATDIAHTRADHRSMLNGWKPGRYAGKHAGGLAGIAYEVARKRREAKRQLNEEYGKVANSRKYMTPHYCPTCDGIPCICIGE